MISGLNFSFRQRLKLGFNNTLFGLSGTIFNFIYSIVIVRFFSPELWGSFAQNMLLITLFSLVTGWGNRDFLLREFSRNPQPTYLWQTSIISRAILFVPLIPILFFFNFTSTNTFIFLVWLFTNFPARSFDGIIVFERKFKEAIVIEFIGFLFTMTTILVFKQRITVELLMLLFATSNIIKSVIYFIVFQYRIFPSFKGIFSKEYLLASLPYFLPPFIGFLQAKSDTFAIALQLSEKELGEYYVLITLLSYCHATAVLAIGPFLKNIYRINSASFKKIRRSFISLGLLWSSICMAIIYIMLNFIYKIELPSYTYAIAWFTLPPYFIYYLVMQDLLRMDKPYTIVIINLVAAILNFLISMTLISLYGFNGGLLSCAVIQWLLLIGFQVAHGMKSRIAANSAK